MVDVRLNGDGTWEPVIGFMDGLDTSLKPDSVHDGLIWFNREHHYPTTWTMAFPAEESGEVLTQPTSEGKS
jgi:predicted transcriptional regulator